MSNRSIGGILGQSYFASGHPAPERLPRPRGFFLPQITNEQLLAEISFLVFAKELVFCGMNPIREELVRTSATLPRD